MSHQSDYLGIHDKAYQRLRADGKSSWSQAGDLNERIDFFNKTIQEMKSGIQPSILVLGCGDGETTLALAKSGCQTTGIDISPTAIAWAAEKAKERGSEARFIEVNITDANPIAKFDVIIDDHCLHCIVGADRSKALSFVKENLKHDGLFIVRTQCGDPPVEASEVVRKSWDPVTRCQVHNGIAGRYFGRPEDLATEFKAAGFAAEQTRVFQYPDGWQMFEGIFRKA